MEGRPGRPGRGSGGVGSTVLPPEAIPLRAAITIEDEEAAKRTAEGPRSPGPPVFTDGSRTDNHLY